MPRKHCWLIFINNNDPEYILNRRQRLKLIKEIIEKKKISSQDELVSELKKMGHEVAQSTISRDIHELRLLKVRDHGQQEFYSRCQKPGVKILSGKRDIFYFLETKNYVSGKPKISKGLKTKP